MLDKLALERDVDNVRKLAPLVHSITNHVVMNFNANALLAVGASPIMAHAIDEMEDMTKICSSLVINIGTLENAWVESMITAGKSMKKLARPIVLDPVGSGATAYRTEVCHKIITECKPTIIRGNGSEIMSLVDSSVLSKGVDSSMSSSAALEAAKYLAQSSGAVVVISGETDYITDGERVETISNGSTMMTSVTGMGCTATAICGAFAAVNPDAFQASVSAMATMGIAGERAAAYSKGSGSLYVNFLDELYNITGEIAKREVRE
ncbi:MAG: hydroxyethylthiazole kinase [Rikenellaceae bacterium]